MTGRRDVSFMIQHHTFTPPRRPAFAFKAFAIVIAMGVMLANVQVARAQTKPTFGVFAYSVFPGSTDPCSIQYVASELPNARYSNPRNGYTLVSTVSGQAAADAEIQRFSMFFDDEPDGVVKLAPCGLLTSILPRVTTPRTTLPPRRTTTTRRRVRTTTRPRTATTTGRSGTGGVGPGTTVVI